MNWIIINWLIINWLIINRIKLINWIIIINNNKPNNNNNLNKNMISGTHCVVTLFKSKVISRVNVEYHFASYHNTVCNFVEKWNAYYNVLCKVKNDIYKWYIKISKGIGIMNQHVKSFV